MEAILYICHGSRIPKACELASSFMNKCMNKRKALIQEYGFLELASPTIDEAFERCIKQGATSIKVIPVLLLTAAHAKKDIPEKLAILQTKYPTIKIDYGRPIGVHIKMIDIVVERLLETNQTLSSNSIVLLVGRGSSDPDVRRDLRQIANLLKRKIRHPAVVDCYLTGEGTRFDDALDYAKKSSATEIFVIPYLFFTGVLMNSMKKQIQSVSHNSSKTFVLCNYLGYHPAIERILDERILELNESNLAPLRKLG